MIFPFRKRSKRQFQKLTDPHVQLLYNMALRYCANRFDAEDILQETMYTAYKNWNQLKDQSKCKAWLLTILRRLYLKEIKQKAKQAFTVEDIDTLALMKDHIALDHSHTFEANETAQTVRNCLAELPEKYQTPTLLYYMDDMGYHEIANTLDIPVGTVMSRLSRAKQLLKKKLLLQQLRARNPGVIVPLQANVRKSRRAS